MGNPISASPLEIFVAGPVWGHLIYNLFDTTVHQVFAVSFTTTVRLFNLHANMESHRTNKCVLSRCSRSFFDHKTLLVVIMLVFFIVSTLHARPKNLKRKISDKQTKSHDPWSLRLQPLVSNVVNELTGFQTIRAICWALHVCEREV